MSVGRRTSVPHQLQQTPPGHRLERGGVSRLMESTARIIGVCKQLPQGHSMHLKAAVRFSREVG